MYEGAELNVLIGPGAFQKNEVIGREHKYVNELAYCWQNCKCLQESGMEDAGWARSGQSQLSASWY